MWIGFWRCGGRGEVSYLTRLSKVVRPSQSRPRKDMECWRRLLFARVGRLRSLPR